jgi:hypothetical protein
LKKRPISALIGAITIILEESEQVEPNKPLPSFLKKPNLKDIENVDIRKAYDAKFDRRWLIYALHARRLKTAEPKRKWIDAILENIVIKIEHVHVILRTRGRPANRGGYDKSPPPLLHLHLKDILIDTADQDWKQVGVAELLARRKAQHAQHVQRQQAGAAVQAELIDVRCARRVSRVHSHDCARAFAGS